MGFSLLNHRLQVNKSYLKFKVEIILFDDYPALLKKAYRVIDYIEVPGTNQFRIDRKAISLLSDRLWMQ